MTSEGSFSLQELVSDSYAEPEEFTFNYHRIIA